MPVVPCDAALLFSPSHVWRRSLLSLCLIRAGDAQTAALLLGEPKVGAGAAPLPILGQCHQLVAALKDLIQSRGDTGSLQTLDGQAVWSPIFTSKMEDPFYVIPTGFLLGYSRLWSQTGTLGRHVAMVAFRGTSTGWRGGQVGTSQSSASENAKSCPREGITPHTSM